MSTKIEAETDVNPPIQRAADFTRKPDKKEPIDRYEQKRTVQALIVTSSGTLGTENLRRTLDLQPADSLHSHRGP
ncbi:hypothetical protein HBH42_163890 [Parastagonospora nodorum]|nr:hypothetical protein HBH42_163890 [Parastagonospora nodorum]